ncbi:hypothetical protein FRC11_002197 [Ceratobasidium sp. 423]|nr:hypothetical protein FRC11_002197 [Ceratobasidium sp. 423]
MRVALHVFHTRQIRTPGRSTISPGILAGLRAIHQAFPLPATSAEAVDSSQYYPADMELDGSLEAFESIELDELLGYFGIEDPAELDEHAQETLDKIHAILHAADISSDVFKP